MPERQLWIYYQQEAKNSTRWTNLQTSLKLPEIKAGLKDRNLKIYRRLVRKDQLDSKIQLVLIGYDGLVKYRTTRTGLAEIKKIFAIIDQMPMRKQEIKEKMAKKSKLAKRPKNPEGELYSDRRPGLTVYGAGYANADKAEKTIQLVKGYPKTYQWQVINTMYNRAKNHPHQTPEMRQAMSVFKRWLTNYRKEL